jgi:6-methylsalicylate decarboxylase
MIAAPKPSDDQLRNTVRIDVHQHLWTAGFVEALRERTAPPLLEGWTLVLDGEPDYLVDPMAHDVPHRLQLNRADRLDLALVSLSTPLGIELLSAAEAEPLLEAYHLGALALPTGFGAWAAACVTEPDPAALGGWLDAGYVGLQLPAVALADRAGFAHCEPLLRALEERGKPLFVHPGPATSRDAPAWWAANVDYVQQMHAAYLAFAAFGRPAHPALKVCFGMLGGLAPLHRERLAARGGPDPAADPAVWFETSSYGGLALTAMHAALGAAGGGDRIVLGSDRPYAAPTALADEPSAERATAGLLGPMPR